jgi:hypothetical protein
MLIFEKLQGLLQSKSVKISTKTSVIGTSHAEETNLIVPNLSPHEPMKITYEAANRTGERLGKTTKVFCVPFSAQGSDEIRPARKDHVQNKLRLPISSANPHKHKRRLHV